MACFKSVAFQFRSFARKPSLIFYLARCQEHLESPSASKNHGGAGSAWQAVMRPPPPCSVPCAASPWRDSGGREGEGLSLSSQPQTTAFPP